MAVSPLSVVIGRACYMVPMLPQKTCPYLSCARYGDLVRQLPLALPDGVPGRCLGDGAAIEQVLTAQARVLARAAHPLEVALATSTGLRGSALPHDKRLVAVSIRGDAVALIAADALVDDGDGRAHDCGLMQERLSSVGQIDPGVLAGDDNVILVALVHLRDAVPGKGARVRPSLRELLRVGSRGMDENASERGDERKRSLVHHSDLPRYCLRREEWTVRRWPTHRGRGR